MGAALTLLSAVVPCYNEAKNLPELIAGFARALRESALEPGGFELVVVENGSLDDSARVIADHAARPENRFVTAVSVAKNQGYGHGMMTGLQAARGQLVATFHADLQCDPRDVFRAYDLYMSSAARPLLVKGVRRGRTAGAVAFTRAMEAAALLLLQARLHEINAQPKLFDRELVAALAHPPLDFRFDLYVLLKARERGYRTRAIDVRFPHRRHGQSNWASSFRSRLRTVASFLQYMAAYRLRGDG
jgi:glycosyltransferase involved in cell wall biosynthesis